jgi:hypothetical protein
LGELVETREREREEREREREGEIRAKMNELLQSGV